MAQFLAVAFTASLIGGIYIKFYKYRQWSKLGLASIEGNLLFGFANRFVFKSANVSDEFKQVYQEFKSKRHGGIYMFFSPIYIPTDPLIIKNVLENENFGERKIYRHSTKDLLFNKLFYVDLDDAKVCRQGWTTLDSPETREIFQENIWGSLESLDIEGIQEITKKLQEINREIVKKLFLNEPVNSANLKDLERNLDKLEMPLEYFATKSVLALLSSNILKLFFARISNKAAIKYFSVEIEKAVNYRKEGEPKNDFLGLLIKNFDDQIPQIITLILGNCKFLSSTIAFCLWELAKNPEIQEKLRLEVSKFDSKSLENLEFLDQIVKETLRKYPTMPIIKRYAQNAFVPAQSSIQIGANTDIIIPICGLHNDPDIFEDPEKFNPERFSKENTLGEYTYLPFGGGTRQCIGQNLTIVQMKLILVKILTKYNIKLETEELELKSNSFLTKPKEIKLKFDAL